MAWRRSRIEAGSRTRTQSSIRVTYPEFVCQGFIIGFRGGSQRTLRDEAVTLIQERSYTRYCVSSFNALRRNLTVERDGFCVHASWLGSPPVNERFTPGDVLLLELKFSVRTSVPKTTTS